MMNRLMILCALLAVVACDNKDLSQGEIPNQDLIPDMEIRELPDTKIVLRQVTGSFERHPAEIEQLQAFLAEKGIETKACLGIYPDDPDAVAPENLHWQIAFEVPADQDSLNSAQYQLEDLPGGTALVVNSSVALSATHGLYCKVWAAGAQLRANPSPPV